MSTIVDTACRYAWSYPIIDMGRGELRNCCRTPFNTISNSEWSMGVDIFKNLQAIKNIKRDLLKGVRSPNCRTCWKSEEVGIKSPRTGIDDFAHFIKAVKWQNSSIDEVKSRLLNLTEKEVDELVELEHPEHIELSLSTTCDLKCVYCSHVFSTQWASERLKYKEITIHELPKGNTGVYEKIWWEWFQTRASRSVHKITFVGGEPLINDKFYEYMEKLIHYYENTLKKNIHFFIVTNFNTPPKYYEKFIEILRKIVASKHISIGLGFSFESIGNRNEFIRTNSDWSKFSSNILNAIGFVRANDTKNKINLLVLPAINTLSVSSLPDLVKYIETLRIAAGKVVRVGTTHVTYPVHYSPFILTPDYATYVDTAIYNLKASPYYRDTVKNAANTWPEFVKYLETLKSSILNSEKMENVAEIRRQFAYDVDKLCSRRNLDFKSTFPEMLEFYKLCRQG